jgi:hypothetical protein
MESIMAVDNATLQSLLADPNVKNLMSNLGEKVMSSDSTGLGGGALGAVLVGALLPRLFNNNNGVDGAVAAQHVLTAADVQNIVSSTANTAVLGNVQGEIWKAEGQVQAALAASTNTAAITTLNAEIANLQGQAAINATIASSAGAIEQAISNSTASSLATTNALASQAAVNAAAATVATLESRFDLAQVVSNDGDKTRALIQNIETASLNRQITVAQNEIAELRHRDAVTSSGVSVTNNINQTASANANAVAQQQIVGLLGQVATSLQHNTQSVVNLGSMIGSPQTATNVRT